MKQMKPLKLSAPVLLLMTAPLIAQDPSWRETSTLFWPLERRDAGFRHMDKIFNSATVPAGGHVHAFGKDQGIAPDIDIDAYMKSQRVAGLIIVHRDKIRLERYALDYDAH